MNTIAENIKDLRTKCGFTQESMARQMGVKSAFVSALERGKRKPGKKTMESLCDVFGVDEQTIRYGSRSDNPAPEYGDQDRRVAPLLRLIVEASSPLLESEQAEVLRLILEMKEARGRL